MVLYLTSLTVGVIFPEFKKKLNYQQFNFKINLYCYQLNLFLISIICLFLFIQSRNKLN
jgi:hypothetical protein